MMKEDLLLKLREGYALTIQETLRLTMTLSLPAIMSQISTVIMEYIDASMVGQLGADGAGAIGLVSSSTWLLTGLMIAINVGFTVQIAQSIGARQEAQARNIVKQGYITALFLNLILVTIGLIVSGFLPVWLGGSQEIIPSARIYFIVFVLFMPAMQISGLAGGMIQGSGNMKVPGLLNVVMCGLNVILNALLIFPSGMKQIAGFSIYLPGAALGVMGAALGTGLAQLIIGFALTVYLFARSKPLSMRKQEHFHFSFQTLKTALKIGMPVAVEQAVMCMAYIISTRIIAPLGTIALAAHSFAVTAEGLCYMPGYGIGAAATTLIGQSVGASRHDMTNRLAWMTTLIGAAFMSMTGLLMYLFAPVMIGLLTPVEEIRTLGVSLLRLEAFAEPIFGASIVATGALRGCGDTLVPSILSFISMWLVRLPLAAYLVTRYGLMGVWMAMFTELWFRGIIFMLRLKQKPWMKGDQL
ncbi:MAG: MATE family efflux transporter [bacterium]